MHIMFTLYHSTYICYSYINTGIKEWPIKKNEIGLAGKNEHWVPCRAKVLYGCFVSDKPSKNRGKYKL